MNTDGLDVVIEGAQALTAVVSALCMAGAATVVVGAVFGAAGAAWLLAAVGVSAGVVCGYLAGRRMSELTGGNETDDF